MLREAMSRSEVVSRPTGGATLAMLILVTGLVGMLLQQVERAAHAPHQAALARLLPATQAEVELTRARGALWLDTEAHLAQARRAAAAGEFDRAFRLARQARHEARLARNQFRLESARYALSLHRTSLAESDAARLAALIVAHDGHAAWSLARRLGVAGSE